MTSSDRFPVPVVLLSNTHDDTLRHEHLTLQTIVYVGLNELRELNLQLLLGRTGQKPASVCSVWPNAT